MPGAFWNHGTSPRHMCRSEPQRLAIVTCTSTSSGPGSGTSYWVIAMPRTPSRVTAALPFIAPQALLDVRIAPPRHPNNGGRRAQAQPLRVIAAPRRRRARGRGARRRVVHARELAQAPAHPLEAPVVRLPAERPLGLQVGTGPETGDRRQIVRRDGGERQLRVARGRLRLEP